jgi:sulfur carrier protein ThiS adenylyltransferase
MAGTHMTQQSNKTQSLSNEQFERYYRQILLTEVGEQGQQALLEQHIMIVGTGGLGSHVAQQLGAAGIGHLYLVDDDSVERSNLPRQILFDETSIGQSKVLCVAKRIGASNLDLSVTNYCERFTFEFADELLRKNDGLQQAYLDNRLWVLDCTDNMSSRQTINAWCAQKYIGLVAASVTAFSGQLIVINGQNNIQAGCYRCVFPNKNIVQNCASAGVLGPTVAVMASMQALTIIKQILGITPPDDQLHIFNAMTLSWQSIFRHRDPQCPACRHWDKQDTQKSSNHISNEAIL